MKLKILDFRDSLFLESSCDAWAADSAAKERPPLEAEIIIGPASSSSVLKSLSFEPLLFLLLMFPFLGPAAES